MQSKRTIFLVLILILVLGVGAYFLFFKKPKKKPKAAAKPVVTQVEESPDPEASPPPGLKIPRGTPLPLEDLRPGATPRPFPIPSPGALLPAGSPFPRPFPRRIGPTPSPLPGEGIPHTESLPTETQPLIDVKLGNPIKTAEGTTLVLQQAEVAYAGKSKLKFLWELKSGSPDLIKIIDPQAPKPRVQLENLDQPSEFVLRLTATDGKTEAAGELSITAFPSRLSRIARTGGAWIGVTHMGFNWVAARGNELQIFNSSMESIAQVAIKGPIAQFFATTDAAGKGAIFVQAPEGPWAVVQYDQVSGSKITQLPMVGRAIRRVVPFVMDGAPYVFALLERNIELWNLSDPLHPRLKTSLGNFLKQPLLLAFSGRNVFVAEEDSIHVIDFATGNLLASVPSGGSISSLSAYSIGSKNFLLAAIDVDRGPQGRKDYGLRVFEIGTDGRLGEARRLSLKGDVPVRKAHLIPNVDLALLAVQEPGGLGLRMVDLKQLKELNVETPKELRFLALTELETGKIDGAPVAVVSDGNQLRVLQFKDTGGAYALSQKSSVGSIVSAAWIQSKADGSQQWVGDEGTRYGGSLVGISGPEFKIQKVSNPPGASFPADADSAAGAEHFPLLYLSEDFNQVPAGEKDGVLALAGAGEGGGVEYSKPFLGGKTPQGALRAFGVAARNLAEGGMRIGIAIARLSGSVGGSGLGILEKPAAAAPGAFLAGDLAQTMSLIPLADARDVTFRQDGRAAFLAAGLDGVLAVDLDKKQPVARMSLGSKEWFADRVLLSHGGSLLLASFLKPGTKEVLLKIFLVGPTLQMQEYGTMTKLPAVETVSGLRAPVAALTEDDLYLFIPTEPRLFSVFNMSNPALPAKIAEGATEGSIRGIAVANRFRDVYLAMGPAGVSKWEFGF